MPLDYDLASLILPFDFYGTISCQPLIKGHGDHCVVEWKEMDYSKVIPVESISAFQDQSLS